MAYEYHINENVILREGSLRRISSNWIFVVIGEGIP